MFVTRVALFLTMIAGAPSGLAYAQIHATMETEFGIHGAGLNDSKSPPPFFSQSVITEAQLYRDAGTFFSGSADGDAFSSTIISILDSDRWSLHENASTKATKRTPRKPTNVTVVPGGSTADCTVWNCFTISWTPQAESGKPIEEFEIQESKDGSTWFLNSSLPFPGGRHQYGVGDNDPPGTTYYIRIRNRDADGWGPWSDVVSAATRAIALYPVEGLRVTADGIHQHRLGWVAPTDRRNLNDAGFKQYTVEWSSDNISWSVLGQVDLQFSTEFIHRSNQLTPGETFYYRVKVTNTKNEVSAPSEVVRVTAATSSGWGIPTGITATRQSGNSVAVSWTAATDLPPATQVRTYRIFATTNGGDSWERIRNSSASSFLRTGLETDTCYGFRVDGIYTVLPSATYHSDLSDEVYVLTGDVAAPVAPTALTATDDGMSTFTLSWTAPASDPCSPITGYQIQQSTDRGSSWTDVIADTGNDAVTYAHTSQTLTARQYRVGAINAAGTGAWSDVVRAGPAIRPAAPTMLIATAPDRTTHQLTWTAPDDGGAAITGYQVESSSTGNPGEFSVLLLASFRIVVPGFSRTVSPGTTEYYRVRANNSVGLGAPSNVVSATTEPIRAPAAPTSLTATADGSTTINLSWTAPTNTGGAAITGYQIESSPTGDSWTSLVANTGVTTTTYAHTGLSGGTTVHYRVSAINSAGPGSASQTASATTAVTAPDAPTSLTAAADGPTTINLSWAPPTNTGGAAITGYQIESSPTGTGDSWTNLVDNTGVTTTTYAHTGLSGGTTRHYRVSAINSEGPGTASNPASATTSTPIVITAPAAPTSLTATADGATTIRLSWIAPTNTGGAAITGYQIESSPTGTGDSWTNLVENTGLTTTTYAHTGLTAGTTLHYRVRAINSEGPGSASNSASATTSTSTVITAPAAPTSLTATADGPTTIRLSWIAPTNTGGAVITGYQIEVSPNGTDNWTDLERSTNSTATIYAHTGLSAGTTRHYRVRAINSEGPGSASNSASATTSTSTVITAPAAPTSLTATADGPTTINLSWTAPTNTGGVAITGYQIEVSPNGIDPWTDLEENTNSTTTTYAHTGLSAGTTRHYRVRAINSAGTGSASNSASATTSTPIVISAPAAPTSLTATSDGQTTINLSWTAPTNTGGAAITGYRIEISEDAGSSWSDLLDDTGTTATTYTHTDLPPETTRHYRVRAINAMGTGPPSLVASATTEAVPVLSFAATIASQRYPAGVVISDLTLPTASGGVMPYAYRLSPEMLPLGLSFDEGTRTIGGTPTQVTAAQAFTWTVTDAVGTTSTMDFTLEIYGITFVAKVENQSYDRGALIAPLVLPEVTGGEDPIQYTLTLLSFPNGLRYDAPTRTIYGTPVQVTPLVELTYRAVDANGAQDSLKFSIEVVSPVHREAERGLPQELIVHSSYPNPFTHSTRIVFDLPWPAQVQVNVMDITGRRVYEQPVAHLSSGTNQTIELRDLTLPAGVYLYQMTVTSPEGHASVHVGHLMRLR